MRHKCVLTHECTCTSSKVCNIFHIKAYASENPDTVTRHLYMFMWAHPPSFHPPYMKVYSFLVLFHPPLLFLPPTPSPTLSASLQLLITRAHKHILAYNFCRPVSRLREIHSRVRKTAMSLPLCRLARCVRACVCTHMVGVSGVPRRYGLYVQVAKDIHVSHKFSSRNHNGWVKVDRCPPEDTFQRQTTSGPLTTVVEGWS